MANNDFSLSANAAIVDPTTGRPSPEFYRYLLSLSKTANNALGGEVLTPAGSGLTGGGVVADGLSLGLDPADTRNVDHSGVSILPGTGLTGGGTIAVSRTLNLADTAVTPGSYTLASLTVDQQGRITSAGNGSVTTAWGSITGTLSAQTDLQTALDAKAAKTTTISPGTGLTGGGDISANRTLTLANTAVTPGSYTLSSITVDAQGRITAASSGTNAGITSLTGDVTATGPGAAAATLASTAVTPGSYTHTSLTVDAKGRLTAASSGATPVNAVTSTDLAIAKFNGTAGQIQNSGVLIDASNNVTSPGMITIGPIANGLTVSNNGVCAPIFKSCVAGAGQHASLILQVGGGTVAAPAFVDTTGAQLARLSVNAWDGTSAFVSQARVLFVGQGIHTATNRGVSCNIDCTPLNSTTITTVLALDGATGAKVSVGTLTLPAYTVAALPAATTPYQKAFVSDALGPAFGVTVVGGGAVKVPVYSDGANWKVG